MKADEQCHHHDTCIRRVPIFQVLTDSEADSLHRLIRVRHYEKKSLIFQEGEQSDTLYIVNKGIIKITKVSEAGKEQILRILFPGDFFGQFALLQNKRHYANAEVIEKADVCLIQKDDFKALIESNPQMAYKLLLTMSERLYQADEWTGSISLLDVEKRLAKTLLLFYDRMQAKENTFQLPIDKKDFASLIGTTAETLSRKLAHFESLQLIELEGRKNIRVINSQGLADVAGQS
jgi:CRP-like cAMP-binding protein